MRKTEIDVLEQLEQKKYHKNYTPLIIVSIILSFVIIVGSVWVLMANLKPAKVGALAYKINWNGYALKLYEREYNKTGNLDSLYMALNISIKTGKDDKVIELYDKFSDNENYNSYMVFVNSENLKEDTNPIIKSTLLNEDNYLKNCYIQSLLNKHEDQTAFNFALSENLNMSPKYDELGNYLFANFCKKDNIDRFYKNFSSMQGDNILIANIYSYMVNINNVFVTYGYSSENEVYIWAMGNRILQVGGNILSIVDKSEVYTVQIDDNEVNLKDETIKIMNNVNSKFKLMTQE